MLNALVSMAAFCAMFVIAMFAMFATAFVILFVAETNTKVGKFIKRFIQAYSEE